MPETRTIPSVGDAIEVRKRHGGGWWATVTSCWRMKATKNGVLVEQTTAILSDGRIRFTRTLHLDETGAWFAWEEPDA